MSSQNVSWDIQDQNDRIISILAWVVVVVLVLYAGVYFYKQARNVAERPAGPNDTRLAQAGLVTPPSTPPVSAPASPSPELALAGGDATRVVSHRPIPQPSPETAPVAPPAPFGTAQTPPAAPSTPAPEPPPSATGYAVRFGKSFPTPKNAQDALFQLPVSVSDVDFVQDGDAWLLQLGKFKTLDEAKSLLKKLQPHAPAAEIVSLDEPAPRPAPKTAKARPEPAAEEPAPKTATRPKATPKPKAPAPKPARGLAAKTGKTAPAAEEEETEEAADEPAPRVRAKATEDSESTSDSGTPSDDATEPRRRAPARRATAAAGEPQPFTADADASGEVDASPTGAANRRPNARSRKTSAGTETPSESSDEEETAPKETSARPTNPAGVQQQLASAARESDSGPRRFSLQVGAYSSEEKARAVAGQLRASGLAARVDESVTGETTVYRVRLGSFGDTAEAQTARRRVAGELGFADVRVIRD